MSFNCAFIREGAEILEGRGVSSRWRFSSFPGETFLRLREAVESRKSEPESRFEDSCVDDPDIMSEYTPSVDAGEGISALEWAIRATMVHEGSETTNSRVEGKSDCYSPDKDLPFASA
jgi:hypothetical protein